MAGTERWLLSDLVRVLRGRGKAVDEAVPEVAPLEQLIAGCEVLMSGIGEPAMRAVAATALNAYGALESPRDDDVKTQFFRHLLDTYGVEAERVRQAYAAWDRASHGVQAGAAADAGGDTAADAGASAAELAELFAVVEPRRQELLRRMNHAPGATVRLVEMRADLRRLMRIHPDLIPLDRDFRHVFASWFNRGFLRMEQVGWDAPRELLEALLRFEKVHPMSGRTELRRRLQPKDRRCYAFFHPATGDIPLIFVEVALTQGVPDSIGPLLAPGPALNPSRADTAVLYSINNALDGLAGISFGSLLIKQVIEQVSAELPHLEQFVTLSPIPGFRRWLQDQQDPELVQLSRDLEHHAEQSQGLIEENAGESLEEGAGETPEVSGLDGPLRERLLPVLARYIAEERREDRRPIDPVARFHLGNGAAAWQLNWPADTSQNGHRQSYGAMINYRYDPQLLERRHEEFVRHRRIALGGQLEDLLRPTRIPDHQRGHRTMSDQLPTIYTSFTEQVRLRPEKELFRLPEGQTMSYAQLDALVKQIAGRLVVDGVRPGDRVAMQVQKSPEALALYLATLQIGGVFLPLNTAYTGAEMDYFLSDAGPRVLVCSPERASEYAGWSETEQSGIVVETLGAHREGSLLSGSEYTEEVFAAAPEDPAAILYTSGTTGRSKGAVLTHGNLASNCHSLLEAWEFTAEDRLIHALPIFHIHGLFVAANMTLAAGASMDFLPGFDAEAILRLLPEATVLMGVPTFYTRLMKSPELTRQLCAGMRLFVSGSAPLLSSDHEEFQARTGHAILERYGMTETGMNTTNPYSEGPRKPGTVGKPLPGVQIRIVDREAGHTLPDGEVGLVEVRGPNVFIGYWQMPEKTEAEFREDGFFITGDLGRIDEDGYLAIVGRDKDLVIAGGYNIYPKEIEELLDAHEDVLESAVIGVPHPDLGEGVVAVVVPAQGKNPAAQDILDAVSADLARFKQPRAVRFAEALPRNVMGKVQKAELRTQHRGIFSPEGTE